MVFQEIVNLLFEEYAPEKSWPSSKSYGRIIADSIKDNLISQVSSRRTPKEMFDALSSLFEGRNINRRMTLKNQLKSVKVQKSKTMQSYFTRVSQNEEQLKAIGDMIK